MTKIHRAVVSKIEQLSNFEDEYVYDIGVDNDTPYVFANNILVHNSCYFSAYEILKNDPDYAGIELTKEDFIAYYDGIADMANESFPAFMQKTFNTSFKRGSIIKAGRELIGSTAYFIKKKKYAILMYDKEGTRLDTGNKPGKLKAMGLDLKRADTPKFMQKFLENILMDLLQGGSKSNIFEQIRDFRIKFKERPAHEKGSPKKVNNLTKYTEKAAKEKTNMPGHVRASINWNALCDANNDKYSMRINDGTRIVVCKLKPNVYKMDSIAFPIDEPHLPKWFFDLPFDHEEMENIIIDKKTDNLLGILDWNMVDTQVRPGDEFFN